MAKKVKISASDIDVTDLAGILGKTIADAVTGGISKGVKDSVKGNQDLINTLKEQLDKGKSRLEQIKTSAEVQTRALQDQISGERAANKIMAERQIKENDLLITKHKQVAAEIEQNMQIALRTDNTEHLLRLQEDLLNKQSDISGLQAVNKEIRDLADEMDHILHQQEERQEMMQEEMEYADKLKEIAEESKELLGSTGKFIDTMKSIFSDSAVAAGIFVGKMNQVRETLLEGFDEIRSEGFTISQSVGKVTQDVGVYFSTWGVGFKEAMHAQHGLVEALGSTSDATTEAIGNAAQLGKTFGIAADEAGRLTGQFMSMPGATAETANQTLEFAGNLAQAAHVAPGAVMKDIANSSEDVAAYTKDGGKNIATAAVAAKKMGLEFGTMTKMADQLLDFETSINKQMEASVLLGKEINLDKARQAAINGDLVGMTQEVLSNLGGEAEYNKLNAVQRKALADSLGVSVQDLNKMVKNQDKLNNLSEEQREALEKGEMSMDEMLSAGTGLFGKLKDSAVTVVSFAKGFSEIKAVTKDILGSVGGIFKGFTGGTGAMGKFKGGLKGAFGLGEEAAEKGTGAADKIKTKGGFKSSMKDLAGGFKNMAGGDVAKGILNTVLAAPALVLAVASIPFLLFMGLTPLKQLNSNFKSLGKGLEAMGTGQVAFGALNLGLMTVGAIAGVAAMPFLLLISAGGKFIGEGLKGLAKGLKAMSDPTLAMGIGLLSLLVISVGAGMALFGLGVKLAAEGMAELVTAIGEIPIENLLLMPVALVGIAAGMGLLAVASLAAAPGLILASVGLNSMVPGMVILAAVAATGALKLAGDAFTAMAASGPGMLQVGAALLAIGGGLTMMAIAGLGAMPVIGALIALAAVAPALSSLGDMFGMGGDEEKGKDDQMQILIDEVRGLRAEMAKGGEVKMDGKKVGEVLRLSMNTSGIR